jgi:hypothetical protein
MDGGAGGMAGRVTWSMRELSINFDVPQLSV